MISGKIKFDFGDKQEEIPKKVLYSFDEGGIYRFSIKPGKTVSVLISLGVPSDFAYSVGEKGHYFLIVKASASEFKYLELSSRFFHFMFSSEIGAIKTFIENDCDHTHKSKFAKYKELNRLITKYSEKKSEIYNYDNVFLLNKQLYKLPMETFVKINKLSQIHPTILQGFIDNNLLDIHHCATLRDIDKKTISHKIDLNIKEDEKNGKQLLQNDELKEVVGLRSV